MFIVNEKGHCVLTGGEFSHQDGQSNEQEPQFHAVVAIKDVRDVLLLRHD